MTQNQPSIVDPEVAGPRMAHRINWYSTWAQFHVPPVDIERHQQLVAVATQALRAVAPWFELFLAGNDCPVHIQPGGFSILVRGEGDEALMAPIRQISEEMARIEGLGAHSVPAGTAIQ